MNYAKERNSLERLADVKNFQIGISGNIGAGKSTFMEFLASVQYQHLILDCFQDNPYIEKKVTPFEEKLDPFTKALLKKYYDNQEEYALITQINFLNSRMKRQEEIQQTPGIIVADRPWEEDKLFAQAQYINGHMNKEKFRVYLGNYKHVNKIVQKPDIYVYLNSSIESLQRKIKHRNRPEERDLVENSDYLTTLNSLYTRWLGRVSQPVLLINADEIKLGENGEIDEDFLIVSYKSLADKIKENFLHMKYK